MQLFQQGGEKCTQMRLISKYPLHVGNNFGYFVPDQYHFPVEQEAHVYVRSSYYLRQTCCWKAATCVSPSSWHPCKSAQQPARSCT